MPTPASTTVETRLDQAVEMLDAALGVPVWQTSPAEQMATVEACQQIIARAEALQASALAHLETDGATTDEFSCRRRTGCVGRIG